jgi:AraC-like DNA-binding protein
MPEFVFYLFVHMLYYNRETGLSIDDFGTFMPNFDFSNKSVSENSAQPDFFSLQVLEARRFYLDLTPPTSQQITVMCGGCEHCGPDYSIHRSDFPYYSIEFVARGKGSLTLAEKDYSLLPGTLFSYGPGIAHDIVTDASDPLIKYFVDFTGKQALKLLRQHNLVPGSFGQVFAPGDIRDVFDDLIQNGLKHTSYSSRICAALLECLVLKTAESIAQGNASQTLAFATYHRCREYIQANSGQLRNLADVANKCEINSAYLCRLFRRYDHQTPYQYLLRLKMNLAAKRLQEPNTGVKQVAAELGFDDPCHFSRSFKSIFGLAPEAFRRLR